MIFSSLWNIPNTKTIEVSGFLEPKHIRKLISDAEYIVKYSKEQEIILLIDCAGGYLGSLNPETGERINYLELIEEALTKIKDSGKTLTAVVQENGRCYSLATDIFNMADIRVTHESATFMFHPAILNAKIAGKENIRMVTEHNAYAMALLKKASVKLYNYLKNKGILKFEHGVETRLYISGDKLAAKFPSYVNGGVIHG
jgi:hypothetical protein